MDFVAFLESNSSSPPPLKTAASPLAATPDDVVKFLFSRDARGKTQVHAEGCLNLGSRGFHDCGCPLRLAAGTLDSMVGKLRAFFNKIGRPDVFSPDNPRGNPCASSEVKEWLKASSLEQRRARVTPIQAPPIFSHHLRYVISEARRRLRRNSALPFLPERFAVLRDIAFFLIQWFAGDRAGDLGRSVGSEVSRLDCGSLLLNHTIGKCIRQSGGDLIVVPSVPEDLDMCPVKALDEYVSQCQDNGVDVINKYLFRPLVAHAHASVADLPFSSSAATKRLRLYLKHSPFESSSFTAHGFRAGCAVTLLLLDCSPDEVKAHCRWASDRVFSHYTKLHHVSRLETSAAALRDGIASENGVARADTAALFYESLNACVPLRAFSGVSGNEAASTSS